MLTLYSFIFPLLGYLSGSLPFSIWVTRYVKHVDVRDAGSGHATTTNTIRQAGFGWGALVLILDIAKGFLPTYLALQAGWMCHRTRRVFRLTSSLSQQLLPSPVIAGLSSHSSAAAWDSPHSAVHSSL